MKTFRGNIKLIVEITETGFSAYGKNIPVYTTGRYFTDLLSNSIEAVNLHLEDDNYRVTEDNIDFEVDLKQFFKHYRVINSKFLARRIGMNETLLSQYVQGRKKPSSKQTQKILFGIREIGKELSRVNFFTRSSGN